MVTLTATSPKYGSAFSGSWSGASKVATVQSEINGEDYYISTATFCNADLSPGTYTVAYTITMTAGHSNNTNATWTGSTAATFTLTSSGLPPSGQGGINI